MGPGKIVKVTLPNWEKYNERADRKNYTWFRFQNDYFSDHAIFSLPGDAQRLHIFCICEASKKNNPTLMLSVALTATMLKLTEKAVTRYLSQLKALGLLEIATGIAPADCRHDDGEDPSLDRPTNERTNETLRNNTNRTKERTGVRARDEDVPVDEGGEPGETLPMFDTADPPSRLKLVSGHEDFDFEAVYERYPCKRGKIDGLNECKRLIKTHERFEQFKHAVEIEARYHARDRALGEFRPEPKHFSTFVRKDRWKECLQPGYGEPPPPKTFRKARAEEVTQNNLTLYQRVERGEI